MRPHTGLRNTLFLGALLLINTRSPGAEPSTVLKQPLPDRVVVLTFDDGVVSHATHVAPLLQEYGFQATFFVCEFPPDFADKTKYMSWEQIAELHTLGFEVANHTRTHRHVDKMDAAEFILELKYIEEKCLEFNGPRPTTFAYPAYVQTPQAVQTLQQQGYHFARIGGGGAYVPDRDHPLLIPSLSTSGDRPDVVINALNNVQPGEILVLTLHGVPDTAHPWVNTPPELFRVYLEYLKEHKFTVLALRDLDHYIDWQAALERPVRSE